MSPSFESATGEKPAALTMAHAVCTVCRARQPSAGLAASVHLAAKMAFEAAVALQNLWEAQGAASHHQHALALPVLLSVGQAVLLPAALGVEVVAVATEALRVLAAHLVLIRKSRMLLGGL